mgnify:FL=1
MLRINQLKLPVGHSAEQLKKKIIKTLQIREGDLKQYSVRKRSIDARKKPELYYVYSIDLAVTDEARVVKHAKGRVQRVTERHYQIPEHEKGHMKLRPVVIGSGPAGLFCAYLLALEGCCPLIAERGAPVRERKADVERFWKTGVLDPSSNVQFGEGGAGTFSDGKLNTLVKDAAGRNRFVLETFVAFGAPEDILWEQKPHIGTDILIDVVEAMRNRIIELGGEFRFHCQVTDILPEENSLVINGQEKIRTEAAVLAIGHSARDTFQMLYDRGINMEAKSFAVGVRVEHPQEMIDRNMYGSYRGGNLPAASYKLAEKLENGRGVYSFCMCPGGYVVNASSEEGRLAVNGMSYRSRDGENANSAIIATVTPADFKSSHPLAGIEFQRGLEEKAWKAGNGKVPVQRLEDYLQNRKSTRIGKIQPNIKGGYTLADVRQIFPEELAWSLGEGICRMGKKIHGFDDRDTILSGVESRTSSPVRIVRNEQYVSSIPWLYPCGEGAGYAGGITSAAMDGMRVAEAVLMRKFTEN